MEEEIANGTSQKPQYIHFVLLVVIGLLIVGGIFYVSIHAKKNMVVKAQALATPTTAVAKQKLQNADFAQFAYKIFPGDLSADAKTALTGFDMQVKALSDGSYQVTLVAKKQEYTTQTLVVKSGESLYFIEKSLGDDHGDEDSDGTLHDDSAVVVDRDGYLVE